MLHIEQEIQEQPRILHHLLEVEKNNVVHIARAIREFNPSFVMVAARGTSDNAARYLQYAFGILAGLPVALATPSMYTLYEAAPNLARALVIGISQSGQSEDIRRVIESGRAQGALTLSITNYAESPLALASHHHIALHAGEEISIAATKTYTAQLAAIALLVAEWVDSATLRADLSRLSEWASETLQTSQVIPQWLPRYRYAEKMAVIGRGYNYATAYELSLKIKELCYITSQEYSEADFRHGPIAMIQAGFPVILIAVTGKTLPLMTDLLHKLREKGAECLLITPHTELAAHYTLPLPTDLPEWLSPICAILPGQVLAMNLALLKGHPVDRPEGLSKVTVTR